MGKHFRFLLLAMLVVTLLAGTAFAGTTFVNNGVANTAYTASLEAMGAARNVTLVGAANGPISYTVTQAITGGNFLQVSFTGAAFAGNQVRVCKADANAAGNQIGIAIPSGGLTSYSIQLATANATATIPVGESVYLTTDAACNNTGAGSNLIVQLSSTSSASTPTVAIGIVSSGNMVVDTTSTKTLANIRPEFTVNVPGPGGTGAHIVDYLGSPGNGTRFTVTPTGATNLTASSVAAANITKTANNYAANNGTAAGGADNASLTVGAVVSLTDTQSWQGVSKVFINTVNAAGGNCIDTAGSNSVGTASPSGTVTLTLPTGAFNGMQSVDLSFCIVGKGTSSLNPRTISGSIDVNVTGTGANDPAASTAGNVDVWTLNAFQTAIPWAVNSTAVPTYCLISNTSTTRTASVIYDVLSSEGGVVFSNQTLGTIAPMTSKLVTITGNSVSLAGGTPLDLTSLGADKRHMDRITVTVAPDQVTVSCIQTDPLTGGKRNVISTF
jgi:hypothetical protein